MKLKRSCDEYVYYIKQLVVLNNVKKIINNNATRRIAVAYLRFNLGRTFL